MTQPDTDPFEGHDVLSPALAHLGRHIRDANGAPSGSPANFEALRGKVYENLPGNKDIDAMVSAIEAEFGQAS